MVPVVIQFLLMTPGVEDVDFSSLRALVYGASPITEAVLTQGIERFGCEFIQVYGLTETTGAIVQLDGADHDPVNRPRLLRSCGKAYPWVEIRSSAGREDVPTASWSSGPGHPRTQGVLASPRTRRRMTPDGWFRPAIRFLETASCSAPRARTYVSGGRNVYPARSRTPS